MSAQPQRQDQTLGDEPYQSRSQRYSVETVEAFDTLQYAKRLQSANVPPEQAEVQAEAIRQILVATKADVDIAAERVIDYTEIKTESINRNLILSINRVDSDMREAFTRTDAKIDEQGRSLNAKIDEQGRSLNAKIDEQGRALTAKIDEQGRALTAKIDEQGERLSEAFASALREAQAANREGNATLRGDVKADLSNQLKWVVGTIIAGFGGLVALLALGVAFLSYRDNAAQHAPIYQQPAPLIQSAPAPVQERSDWSQPDQERSDWSQPERRKQP